MKSIRDVEKKAQSGRWPALDGMRGVGILAVMVVHLGDPHLLPGGGLAVDVFFVISGFLITSILLGEEAKSGRVRCGMFYMRRALRLFPALAVVLAVVTGIALLDRGALWSRPTLAGLPFIVGYVGNWFRAFSSGVLPLGALGQTWSLAVEEQFYLVWPLVFVLAFSRLRDRRKAAIILASIAAVVMAYRVVALAHGWSVGRISNGTDTHCDGLLVGCALAEWLSVSQPSAGARHVSRYLSIVGLIALATMVLAVKSPRVLAGAGYPVAELATAAILWNQVTRPMPAFARVLTSDPLRWVGRRSYGLYLWHYPIYIIVAGGVGVAPREWPLVIILSFAAAAVSFRYVEEPFLRRKQHFETVSAVQGIEEQTSEPVPQGGASPDRFVLTPGLPALRRIVSGRTRMRQPGRRALGEG
jgi:peptidoglycan/LPS O-acetylase OafA/YrhL